MSAPVKNLKDGWFSTGIFEAEKDGRKYYQISLQKGFKRNGSDEVEHQTISVFHDDLLKVASLCERTYWSILAMKEAGFAGKAKESAEKPAPVATPAPAKPSVQDEIPF